MLVLVNKFKIHGDSYDCRCWVKSLSDKRFTVLQAMGTITHSTDMEGFMRLAGLTSSELLQTLKDLAQDGFVMKTKHGYAIADRGKLALTALTRLPDDKAFRFYVGVGQPTGVSARSNKEFYNVVENIAAGSLEFHLERGDFEKWIRTSMQDEFFAAELAGLRKAALKGEALRKQILMGLQARFGEEVLLLEWCV